MTNSNILRQSIFSLAPNHEELTLPGFIQGNNPLRTAAIRFYGVGGSPTTQGTIKHTDGNTYHLIIGQFQGTETIEDVNDGQRYAPLQGHFTSPLHLPQQTYGLLNDTFPIPPELNISFLLSDDSIKLIKEISQGNGIRNNEFHKNSQNSWLIRVEMNLHQTITLLSPTTRNTQNGDTNGFQHVPSILLKEPIKVEPGVNIMAYSQFVGGYPYSRLTSEELTHPIVSHLIQLITYNREYGFNQSVSNGSRAYNIPNRNENLPAVKYKQQERTSTPTTPTQFMDDTEDDARLISVANSSSTPLTNRLYQ